MMQLAAPAHRQWLLLFFCTSKLIGTNPLLLALIQGEILSLEEDGGGVLWLCSCQQVIFQAKPARMATDVLAREHSKHLLSSNLILGTMDSKSTALTFLSWLFAWAGDVYKPLTAKKVLS